ncbi:MAG: N-acetylglucosamine kinase, partial [Ginsengibacter sp.]
GNKIVKNSPGLGFILGDEGSGAYLGKKVIQYYLYQTFDKELMQKFRLKFGVGSGEILTAIYKKPLPNRYLASFALFLAENRGHYMIENIIEDGLNDFFYNHLDKYQQSRTVPLHFVGSIAYGFKDVLSGLCDQYKMNIGKVIKNPMLGLVKYYGGI